MYVCVCVGYVVSRPSALVCMYVHVLVQMYVHILVQTYVRVCAGYALSRPCSGTTWKHHVYLLYAYIHTYIHRYIHTECIHATASSIPLTSPCSQQINQQQNVRCARLGYRQLFCIHTNIHTYIHTGHSKFCPTQVSLRLTDQSATHTLCQTWATDNCSTQCRQGRGQQAWQTECPWLYSISAVCACICVCMCVCVNVFTMYVCWLLTVPAGSWPAGLTHGMSVKFQRCGCICVCVCVCMWVYACMCVNVSTLCVCLLYTVPAGS
jgi:hypothetical protein